MTNATVAETVAGVRRSEHSGQVQGRGKESRGVAGYSQSSPSLPANKSEIKPGAKIIIFGATKKEDGTLETGRIAHRPRRHRPADCDAKRNPPKRSSPRRRGPITTDVCGCAGLWLQRYQLHAPVVMGPGSRFAWPGRRRKSHRQHVVVDLGDGIDPAQSHGRGEFLGDDLDRLGNAGFAGGPDPIGIGRGRSCRILRRARAPASRPGPCGCRRRT